MGTTERGGHQPQEYIWEDLVTRNVVIKDRPTNDFKILFYIRNGCSV
jgi:hypothetical protein